MSVPDYEEHFTRNLTSVVNIGMEMGVDVHKIMGIMQSVAFTLHNNAMAQSRQHTENKPEPPTDPHWFN
jgi:hypothetical protein